ncbi:MAG TPA: helix-turn-helix transcriptional regulator [Pseudonocardiaceae bacterium]|nr:helix-turn-helix transcriptional regulator [Pseudonocardiaceae bacterium]
MIDFATALGERVRAARIAASMTQDMLGDTVGWKRSMVSNVEAGRSRVLAEKIPRLAQELGVSVVWLLTGDGEWTPPAPHHAMARHAYRTLTGTARQLYRLAAVIEHNAAELVGDDPAAAVALSDLDEAR